jgi:hypothetical protein
MLEANKETDPIINGVIKRHNVFYMYGFQLSKEQLAAVALKPRGGGSRMVLGVHFSFTLIHP